jgi:nitrite reductase/ring-hydroxylating ferredoxin subunit
VSEIPPGTAAEFVVDEQIVALFNVAGRLYALDGICPHQGGPLGKGSLQGGVVTCPWHGWQFDVRTGQHQVNASLCHPRYEVRVDEGDILVLLGNQNLTS